MTLTRSHTTEPYDGGEGGSYRTWWVADGLNRLALSVQHWPNGKPAWMPAVMPSVDVGFGVYVLDAFFEHRPADPDFDPYEESPCRFHDACEPSALSGPQFTQAWQRIAAASVTDEAVYAELETLHAVVFEAVER